MDYGSLPVILRVALILTVVKDFALGALWLLAPMLYFEIGGSTLFDPGFIRWAGAPLVGLGFGGIWVLRAPSGQRALVDTLLITYALAALAHTYTIVTHQYSGAGWVIGMPMAGVWITTLLLAIGRYQGRASLLSGAGSTTR